MRDDYNYEPYQYGDVSKKEEVPADNSAENREEPKVEERNTDSTYSYKYNNYYEYTREPAYRNAPSYTNPEPKRKKGGFKKFLAAVALAVVFGLVASGVFMGSVAVFGDRLGIGDINDKQTVTNTKVYSSSNSEVNSDIADVVENVMPSVVSITNVSVQEVQDFFFGTQQIPSESRGSGVILGQNEQEMLIVTNYHVVKESTELTVTFIDDSNAKAQIKGTDAKRDLAIVSVRLEDIANETMGKIKIATLGNSDTLRVGETTIVIGNALGYGQSVTTGIISALDRELEDYEGKLIQTDAAINQGNSGGALLNANGELIGINSAKLYGTTVESMGYAIPISDVTDILDDLMTRATRTKVAEEKRGSLGIRGVTVDETYASVYNMPQGVFVSQIIEGGAAEKAGLPVNSVIVELDGITLSSMEELIAELEYYEVGETVELLVMVPDRNGYVEETMEVTLYRMEQ